MQYIFSTKPVPLRQDCRPHLSRLTPWLIIVDHTCNLQVLLLECFVFHTPPLCLFYILQEEIMSKAVKWILITVAGIVCLGIIAAVTLPFVIDPNDYKDKITELVYKQTGRKLLIPGDIRLKVSPKLDAAFSLGEIQLESGAGFADTSFASSKLAEIKLALWPLISQKQLQVTTVVLRDVQLNLVRNKDGKGNWEDLVAGQTDQKEALPQENNKQSAATAADKQPMQIDIGGVEALNINLHYRDEQSGLSLALTNFNLKTGRLQYGHAFPLTADFRVKLDDGKKSPVTAALTVTGDTTYFAAGQRCILKNFTVRGTIEGDFIPARKLDVQLVTDTEINAAAEKIIVHALSVSQGEVQADAALVMNGFHTPAVSGELKIKEFSPVKQMKVLGLDVPRFTKTDAMESFAGAMQFRLKDNSLLLDDIRMQVDETAIDGRVQIIDLKKPAYELILNIDNLDVDRYALKAAVAEKSPATSGPKKPTAANAAARQHRQDSGVQPVLIPAALLKDLNFTADIKIAAVKASGLKTSNLVVKADGKDGLITLHPFSAALYGGTMAVNGTIDARPKVPQIHIKKVLKGIQLGPLFVDLTGKEEISGQANISADMTTKGLTVDELTANANGTLQLSLADAQIAKLKILHTIRLAKSLLDNTTMTLESSDQPTGFASLTASGTVKNGVFTNNDLLAASELMKVSGKGTVDLVNQQIDYLLTVYLTDRIEREQGTGLVELGKTPIPYRVKGSFTNIEQSAAIEELVKAKAEELIRDELQKQLLPDGDKKGKSGIDAESLLQQGLKGLFGN